MKPKDEVETDEFPETFADRLIVAEEYEAALPELEQIRRELTGLKSPFNDMPDETKLAK